jgi:hypothetical protein
MANGSAAAMDPAFALNEDGSAKDVAAFRAAVRADPQRMAEVNAHPEVAKLVLDSDDATFQKELRQAVQVCTCPWKDGHRHAVGLVRGAGSPQPRVLRQAVQVAPARGRKGTRLQYAWCAVAVNLLPK